MKYTLCQPTIENSSWLYYIFSLLCLVDEFLATKRCTLTIFPICSTIRFVILCFQEHVKMIY